MFQSKLLPFWVVIFWLTGCTGDAVTPLPKAKITENGLLGYGPRVPDAACQANPPQFLWNEYGDSLGTAEIFATPDTRYVKISLRQPWVLKSAAIFVGAEGDFPLDHNQTPQTERFPIQFEMAKPLHERVLSFPASENADTQCSSWSLHCEVGQLDFEKNLYNLVDVWMYTKGAGTPYLNTLCEIPCE